MAPAGGPDRVGESTGDRARASNRRQVLSRPRPACESRWRAPDRAVQLGGALDRSIGKPLVVRPASFPSRTARPLTSVPPSHPRVRREFFAGSRRRRHRRIAIPAGRCRVRWPAPPEIVRLEDARPVGPARRLRSSDRPREHAPSRERDCRRRASTACYDSATASGMRTG